MFFIKKEPVVLREMVDCGHSTPSLCAMCDLRMMGVMSSGTSSDEEYEEHNVKNLSLEVVEQGWSGGLVCLADWELGRVALSCHLALDLLVSGNARGMVAAAQLPCCALKVSPILEGCNSMESDVMGEQRALSLQEEFQEDREGCAEVMF